MNTTLDLESIHPKLVELVEPCRERIASANSLINVYMEKDFAEGCIEMAYQVGLINCSEHCAYRAVVAVEAQAVRDAIICKGAF